LRQGSIPLIQAFPVFRL